MYAKKTSNWRFENFYPQWPLPKSLDEAKEQLRLYNKQEDYYWCFVLVVSGLDKENILAGIMTVFFDLKAMLLLFLLLPSPPELICKTVK